MYNKSPYHPYHQHFTKVKSANKSYEDIGMIISNHVHITPLSTHNIAAIPLCHCRSCSYWRSSAWLAPMDGGGVLQRGVLLEVDHILLSWRKLLTVTNVQNC